VTGTDTRIEGPLAHKWGNTPVRRNCTPLTSVYSFVKRSIWAFSILFAVSTVAAYGDYESAQRKVDSIEGGRLPSGSQVTFTYPELTAWAARQAPPGVRNLNLRVTTPGVAVGTAIVDFAKVSRSQGHEPGWMMSKLLDGERPVSVTAHIVSGGGHATVDVQRVEISGLTIDGKMLDFLIENVLLPLYPTAAIGRPFEMGDRIDRFDVRPHGVTVIIGK